MLSVLATTTARDSADGFDVKQKRRAKCERRPRAAFTSTDSFHFKEPRRRRSQRAISGARLC